MLKVQAKFSPVKMEKLFRYSGIHLEPKLGIARKACDAGNMVTPLRTVALFSHHHRLSAHRQPSLSLPVLRVIKTARPGVLDHELLNGGTVLAL